MAIARISQTGGPVDMGKIPQQLPVRRPRPLRHALLRRAEPGAHTTRTRILPHHYSPVDEDLPEPQRVPGEAAVGII